MRETTIQERLAWPSSPELHDKIRRLWIKHSIAEDKRNLQGLIDTLAEDCVYHVVPTGQRWEGHDGARQFYTTFATHLRSAQRTIWMWAPWTANRLKTILPLLAEAAATRKVRTT